MSSCLLFHGPGAKAAALERASRVGRLLASPFGEAGANGLKVAEARAFVALMLDTPVGDQTGVVIAGPMDLASPQSSDTLLKCIEEFSPHVQPILWANDLGAVQPTIRSRCLDFWAPPTGLEEPDEVLEGTARDLIRASLAGSYDEIPTLLKRLSEKGSGWPSSARLHALLAETADGLTASLGDPKSLALWGRLRSVARWRDPQPVEVLAAFLSEPT